LKVELLAKSSTQVEYIST